MYSAIHAIRVPQITVMSIWLMVREAWWTSLHSNIQAMSTIIQVGGGRRRCLYVPGHLGVHFPRGFPEMQAEGDLRYTLTNGCFLLTKGTPDQLEKSGAFFFFFYRGWGVPEDENTILIGTPVGATESKLFHCQAPSQPAINLLQGDPRLTDMYKGAYRSLSI